MTLNTSKTTKKNNFVSSTRQNSFHTLQFEPAFTPESGLFLSRNIAQLQITKICHSFATTAIFYQKNTKAMDSRKEINIWMILFIVFLSGLASGMALPDGLTQIIVGIVLALIVLGLSLKSVIEHLQAHDQRVIEMTDMAHYTASIYGNQSTKQKQEKQDENEETKGLNTQKYKKEYDEDLEDASERVNRIKSDIAEKSEGEVSLEINN